MRTLIALLDLIFFCVAVFMFAEFGVPGWVWILTFIDAVVSFAYSCYKIGLAER